MPDTDVDAGIVPETVDVTETLPPARDPIDFAEYDRMKEDLSSRDEMLGRYRSLGDIDSLLAQKNRVSAIDEIIERSRGGKAKEEEFSLPDFNDADKAIRAELFRVFPEAALVQGAHAGYKALGVRADENDRKWEARRFARSWREVNEYMAESGRAAIAKADMLPFSEAIMSSFSESQLEAWQSGDVTPIREVLSAIYGGTKVSIFDKYKGTPSVGAAALPPSFKPPAGGGVTRVAQGGAKPSDKPLPNSLKDLKFSDYGIAD